MQVEQRGSVTAVPWELHADTAGSCQLLEVLACNVQVDHPAYLPVESLGEPQHRIPLPFCTQIDLLLISLHTYPGSGHKNMSIPAHGPCQVILQLAP